MLSDKKFIRRHALQIRDSVSHKAAKDEKIKEALIAMPEFKRSDKILLYASFRSEVDTFELLKYCLLNKKRTILPKVDIKNMELRLYEIKDISELSTGYLGIPEPNVSEDKYMQLKDMDLIIVPGAAFDENCSRLGYGKGFYDKLLSGVRDWGLGIRIIGLAYEEQVVKFIPSDEHDIKMDKIITDKRVIEHYGH